MPLFLQGTKDRKKKYQLVVRNTKLRSYSPTREKPESVRKDDSQGEGLSPRAQTYESSQRKPETLTQIGAFAQWDSFAGKYATVRSTYLAEISERATMLRLANGPKDHATEKTTIYREFETAAGIANSNKTNEKARGVQANEDAFHPSRECPSRSGMPLPETTNESIKGCYRWAQNWSTSTETNIQQLDVAYCPQVGSPFSSVRIPPRAARRFDQRETR
ncbi:hypothetical protein BJ508DRAFT_305191 [Ascobolus immersus RN42]|uniref:Uncharacterized protein n=1 Tax=Ascobolus immersus RN42 TaxID=1160509 RepID=A0A3N4IFC7_ASCIM|nr:hypothetical protein BJ508DRAFT_305191 [Ascobolus immersus RN42]